MVGWDEKITTAKDALKKAHNDKNLSEIEKYTEELNTVWQEASQDIYQAQQNQDSSSTNEPKAQNDGQGNDSGSDDVQDADFEEVK